MSVIDAGREADSRLAAGRAGAYLAPMGRRWRGHGQGSRIARVAPALTSASGYERTEAGRAGADAQLRAIGEKSDLALDRALPSED